jgi:chromatin remodeling complex protein RSC6
MSVEKIEILVKQIEIELKNVKKELKKLKKDSKTELKKERKNGLTKEYVLSDELCTFLNIANNSKMSRTNVTKNLLEYIKINKLGNKRQIKVDDKLKLLINEEEVTYFTIQKCMNKHYKYD